MIISKKLKDCFEDWKKFYIALDKDIEDKLKDGLNINEEEIFHKWRCRLLDLSNVESCVLFEQIEDGSFVGMLSYCIVKQINCETYNPSYYIYICDFYVLPEYRSIGIGKSLLNVLKHKTHEFDIKDIFVGTVAENNRAVKFYHDNDFNITGYNFKWSKDIKFSVGINGKLVH
jgi:ribosomal protein S18 acetylase RimI-like enzyme